jgi:beta-phosphoglucomutase
MLSNDIGVKERMLETQHSPSFGRSILALAFDLDGVLWESTGSHRAAFEQVLRREGIENFDYGPYAGMRTTDVMRNVFEQRGRNLEPGEYERLAGEKSRLAREFIKRDAPLAAGCREVLAALRASHRLGLASSGSRSSVELFLEMSQTRDCFTSVLSGDDVRRAKPDAEIYLRTAAALAVAPGEMLVVEDAVSGVRAACAAGSPALGLSRDPEQAGRLLAAGAVEVVAELKEIVSSVSRMNR